MTHPYDVKSKFLKLNSSHIEYVMNCLKENTSKVRNIKKYLLAALFNAPTTISGYYQAEVNHDMYGVIQNGKKKRMLYAGRTCINQKQWSKMIRAIR